MNIKQSIDNQFIQHPKASMATGALSVASGITLGALAGTAVIVLTGAAAVTGWGLIALAIITGIGLLAKGLQDYRSQNLAPQKLLTPPQVAQESKPASLKQLLTTSEDPNFFKDYWIENREEELTVKLLHTLRHGDTKHISSIIENLRDVTEENIFSILQAAIPLAKDQRVKEALEREVAAEVAAGRTKPFTPFTSLEPINTTTSYINFLEVYRANPRKFRFTKSQHDHQILLCHVSHQETDLLEGAIQTLRQSAPHNVHAALEDAVAFLEDPKLPVPVDPKAKEILEREREVEKASGRTNCYIQPSRHDYRMERLKCKLDKLASNYFMTGKK